MMKSLLYAVLITSSLPTLAEPLIEIENSPFLVLKELFIQSPAATFSDIDGWMTGRCYDERSPNTVLPQLLVGEVRASGGDNGPLFLTELQNKFILVQDDNARSSEHYDLLTDSIREDIWRSIYLDIDGSLPAEINGGS